jgi:hypothetical protein
VIYLFGEQQQLEVPSHVDMKMMLEWEQYQKSGQAANIRLFHGQNSINAHQVIKVI